MCIAVIGCCSAAAKVTPLILAICTKSFYTAQNLIEFGADINKPDENGVTPLMYAVKYVSSINNALKLYENSLT